MMIKKIKNWYHTGSFSSPVVESKNDQIFLQSSSLFLDFALGYSGGKITPYQAMSLYRQSSALSTAVDIITQEMASIEPVLKDREGNITSSHPLLDRLNNPNDYAESWGFFFSSLGMHRLITGNAFMYGAGTVTLPPIELYAVNPQNVSTTEGDDKYPSWHVISSGVGASQYTKERTKYGFRYYNKDGMREIFQTARHSSYNDNTQGDSPLLSICLDIQQQIKGREHNKQLLANGSRPSMLANFKDCTSQDDLRERRQLLNEQLGGASNAGKIVVTGSSDLDLKEMSTTNKDMDFYNLERIAEQSIYNRYRIPLPLVTNDASTYSNLEKSVESLYDFAVLPITNDILAAMTMFLLPRYGIDPAQFRLTYDPDTIGVLKSRRLRELRERKEIGIETYNELREGLSNRESISGGDSILVSATMTKLEEIDEEMELEEEVDMLSDRDAD